VAVSKKRTLDDSNVSGLNPWRERESHRYLVRHHLMRRVPSIVPSALAVLMTACDPPPASERPPILLFTGAGTSSGDVAAMKRILDDKHLTYRTATSAQLNSMSTAQLMAYRLIIIPGGNFIDMGASLTPRTT